MKNIEKFEFEIGDIVTTKDGNVQKIVNIEVKNGMIGMYQLEDKDGKFWQAAHLTHKIYSK